MALDVSGLTYFMPLYSFLLVFILMLAIFEKTKIFGNKFINFFISLIMATIFVTVTSIRQYVESVVPWVVLLLVAIFFILIIVGFSQKDISSFMKPTFAKVFIAILVVIFLISAVNVFWHYLTPYPSETGVENDFLINFKEFFYSSKFLGAFLLLILAGLTAWIITKK